MNETIGVKGGKNDRRRTFIITEKQKKKLEEDYQLQKEAELKKLEKKVNLQQKITLLTVVPIAVLGQVYLTLTQDNEKKKELALKEAIDLLEKENLFSESETKIIINALKEGRIFDLEEDLLGKLGLSVDKVVGTKQISEIDITDFSKDEPTVSEEIEPETKSAILSYIEITLEERQENLFKDDHEKSLNISSEEINTKTTINEKLEKLKNHKIIDEYESKLKEVRKDLRTLIFEYNVVSEASDNLYNPKEAEDLLERLNYIIKKVEELKSKINIPDIDKYDDNYLYTLVEQYIEDFKNNRFVSEIKDSALYIMISEKLSELDVKKDSLQNKIEQRKEKLEIDESRIEQIKEKYYNFEKFNSELKKFNDNQEYVLKDIREKMANAVTIEERVETQIVGMQRQGRRLLQLMAASLMLPGARSARGLATMTASYLYFMRNIMRPNVTTRTLRTPVVTDYHKEIEKSISQLEDISETLHKTSRQIDLTIKEVKVQFEEYMNVIPECKALLLDLEKIKAEIEEKEYELKRIKEEQEKNLEKNDAKVKRMTN